MVLAAYLACQNINYFHKTSRMSLCSNNFSTRPGSSGLMTTAAARGKLKYQSESKENLSSHIRVGKERTITMKDNLKYDNVILN